jgi:hypothetical protein
MTDQTVYLDIICHPNFYIENFKIRYCMFVLRWRRYEEICAFFILVFHACECGFLVCSVIYSLVDGYQHFGGTCYLCHTPKLWQLSTIPHSITFQDCDFGISALLGLPCRMTVLWVGMGI